MCNGLAFEDQDAGPTLIALRIRFFIKSRPLPQVFPCFLCLGLGCTKQDDHGGPNHCCGKLVQKAPSLVEWSFF